jgi:hypothetical protein
MKRHEAAENDPRRGIDVQDSMKISRSVGEAT